MKELGLTELIPAMCQFDYTMSAVSYTHLTLTTIA